MRRAARHRISRRHRAPSHYWLAPLERRELLSGFFGYTPATGHVVPTFQPVPVLTTTQISSLTVTVPTGTLSYGQPINIKAHLALAAPKAGQPLFLDWDVASPAGLFDAAGNASFTMLPLPGQYNHVASFAGNATLPTFETDFSFTVGPAPTALVLDHTNAQTITAAVQLSKSFSPSLLGTLDGTMSLFEGSTLISSTALQGNPDVAFNLPPLTPGVHHYEVDYSGSALFAPSSGSLNLTYVAPAPTSLAVVSSAPIQMGRTVTLTATVSPSANNGAVQGTVQFFVEGTYLATGRVSGGKASVPFVVPSNLAQSTLDFSALFQSTSNYLDSAAPQLTLPTSQKDVIDVLALMSREVLNDQANATERFNEEIARANQAFANSNIPLELRVVAIGSTNYSESGDIATDLNRLDTAGDGAMDEVFGLRNGYGADLVVLMVSTGSPSGNDVTEGIANQLVNPSSSFRSDAAFMAIDINAPLSDYVLAHEVGHTLGAGHALGDPDSGGAASYAHGYRFTGNDGVLYHDIMAYYPGKIVAGFSSPLQTFEGVPFGNAKTADNARIIRQDAPIVAAYRVAKPIASIDTATKTEISGYALDPRIEGPLSMRVDVDKTTGSVFEADDPYGTIQHGYTFQLPALTRGKHTVKLFGLDTYTGQWVLLVTKTITG